MRRIAMCGNPNCGKTTLFNSLTGENLHTGNYNGVTVSEYETALSKDIVLCDLPGIYSLSHRTGDEAAATDYINKSADCLLIVADGTLFQHSEKLIVGLLDLNKPSALIITMADLMEKDGISVDCDMLSNMLGIPVVLHHPGDEEPILKLLLEEQFVVSDKIFSMEDVHGCFSAKLSKPVFPLLDRILLCTHAAIPIMLTMLIIPLYLIFGVLSPIITSGLEFLLDLLIGFMQPLIYRIPYFLRIFLLEAGFGGIYIIAGFLPPVVLTFVFLAILEESGIAARIAVVMSKIASCIGIPGRSFISFLLGFGCTVPAVLSLRAMEIQDGKRAAMILPFFQCSAKIPVFMAFAAVFFGKNSGFAIVSIYAAGVIAALSAAYIINLRGKTRATVNDISELPRYRIPALKKIQRLALEKCGGIIHRAVTSLFIISCVVWILSHIDVSFKFIDDGGYDTSLIYMIGSFIAPLFEPLGFGTPYAVTSLLCGFAAKEAIITSLAMQVGGAGIRYVLYEMFSLPSAISYMAFVALYPPCISAVSAVAVEFGREHAIKCVMWQFAAAYTTAFVIYNVLV